MKSFKLSEYISLKSLGLIVGGSLLFSLAMNLLIVPMSLYIDVMGNFEVRT